jgi:DNA-binding PadR family transcriptional regulator
VIGTLSRLAARRAAERQRRILAVLLLHDVLQVPPPSGYPLMKATGDHGATVYVALDKLESAGYVVGEWEPRVGGDDRPRRRFYRLTNAGRMHARVVVSRWLRGEEGASRS